MSLAEDQRLLARLYTDAALRERFFDAPQEVGGEWGLAEEDASALARTREQVECFANSLVKKRLRGVQQMFPRTTVYLEGTETERFPEGRGGRNALHAFFGAYIRSPSGLRPPEGPRKIPEDALRFAAFVQAQSKDASARALARFEAAWVRAHAPGFRFAIGFFRGSIHLWWRIGRLRHLSWPL